MERLKLRRVRAPLRVEDLATKHGRQIPPFLLVARLRTTTSFDKHAATLIGARG
jgi:hypothetical protein